MVVAVVLVRLRDLHQAFVVVTNDDEESREAVVRAHSSERHAATEGKVTIDESLH